MLNDLRSYILADSGVSALIGTRFRLGLIPQNATYPYCRYSLVSEIIENTHSDVADKTFNRDIVQIDVFGKSAVGVLAVKDALRDALNSKSFIKDDTNFGYIELDNSSSDYEPDTELFRQTISFRINWSPA